MRQNHFHVSAKTIDDTLLFPKTFNGENFLVQSVIESAQSFGVHIAHVTNDEKMLYAIASDMMMRGMSARKSYNTGMRN